MVKDSHLEMLIDTETDEFDRMLYAVQLYQPDADIEKLLIEAYSSKEWDYKKCDGCTAVSELHSPPGLKFWPCVLHDYCCWLVANGRMKVADAHNMFYRANIQFGASKATARRRWLGVWLGYYCYFKWAGYNKTQADEDRCPV